MTSSANEATAKRTGQAAGFLEEVFANTDTSDFVGPVRCTAPAEGEGVSLEWAVELDTGNRIFTTLPVVPVEREKEATSQE